MSDLRHELSPLIKEGLTITLTRPKITWQGLFSAWPGLLTPDGLYRIIPMGRWPLHLYVCPLILTGLLACQERPHPPQIHRQSSPVTAAVHAKKLPKVMLASPNGRLFTVYVAKTPEEQTQGLSGIAENEFSEQEGMLFYYPDDRPHRFWMPDTYFDLDIFFLGADLKILDVDRNVPAHPGRQEPPPIATTRTVTARHVLELKSSEISRSLKVGEQLSLQSGTL